MPFVPELLNFLSDVFFETGTFQGDTVNIVANNNIHRPSKILSIELSDVFINNCRKRFEKNRNIYIYKGNSKYDLYDKIKDINSKITFWLDSHWSGTPNVGCDPITVCPVLEELEQIKRHPIKTHTIMIDDIRLMNNSNDKGHGFPVTKEEILSKIYEINPNYTISYFDDYTASKDVLVAHIESKIEKKCIHTYLTKCQTNPQPPGFADFLRGTIALYNFSKVYGYELLIDENHPVFKYLNSEKITKNDYVTEELLPPLSYNRIYLKLEKNFKEGKPFSVMTNSLYTLENGSLSNFGKISPDCSEYMKGILNPSLEVQANLDNVFKNAYKINDKYKVIHLRFGDKFIHKNEYSEELYNKYYKIIVDLVKDDAKYVLISDSKEIANKLKENIPELFYWDNTKIHLGDLINIENNLLDTITDFFIISKSSEIISNGSGFSMVNSEIYNIKYTLI